MAEPAPRYVVAIQVTRTDAATVVPQVRATRIHLGRHVPVEMELPHREFPTERSAIAHAREYVEESLQTGPERAVIEYVGCSQEGGGEKVDDLPVADDGALPLPDGQTVLLVEDSPVAHEKISGILRDMGCAVMSAFDGVDGLAVAKEHAADLDLIVLDIQMPRMDGITALRYLRQLDSLSRVPIVMLTTQADKETVRTALSHKANDYIRKDSSITAIAERLRRHLASGRRRDQSGPAPPQDARQGAEMARQVLQERRAPTSSAPTPWVLFYEGQADLGDMETGKNLPLAHFYAVAVDVLERLNHMYRGLQIGYGLENERQTVSSLAVREEAPMSMLVVSGRRPDGASLARMIRFAGRRQLPIYLVCESLQSLPIEQAESLKKADVAVLDRRRLGPRQLEALFARHLVPEFRQTDSGLRFHELETGSGPSPQVGQMLTLHYRGSLTDGTEVGDTYASGEPFQFRLGKGEVVQAWDEAAALMKKGSRALVVAPPELVFGAEGDGYAIPPGATLVYSMELLAIDDDPEAEDDGEYAVGS